MHTVSANYTLPTVLNTLQPAATSGIKKAISGKATTAPTTTATTSSSTSASSLSSTFLNLLATELQNQDPTAPVDSTAMVGQMISLNQLDQLISINQTVTGSTGTGTTGLVQPAGGTASDAALSSVNGGLASTLSPSVAGAVSQPTAVRPQHDDAPKLRQCRRGGRLHQFFYQSSIYGLFQYQQQYLRR